MDRLLASAPKTGTKGNGAGSDEAGTNGSLSGGSSTADDPGDEDAGS